MGERRFGSRVLMRFRIDLALVEFSDFSNTPDMRLLRPQGGENINDHSV